MKICCIVFSPVTGLRIYGKGKPFFCSIELTNIYRDNYDTNFRGELLFCLIESCMNNMKFTSKQIPDWNEIGKDIYQISATPFNILYEAIGIINLTKDCLLWNPDQSHCQEKFLSFVDQVLYYSSLAKSATVSWKVQEVTLIEKNVRVSSNSFHRPLEGFSNSLTNSILYPILFVSAQYLYFASTCLWKGS
jgi:hypothetical protein